MLSLRSSPLYLAILVYLVVADQHTIYALVFSLMKQEILRIRVR